MNRSTRPTNSESGRLVTAVFALCSLPGLAVLFYYFVLYLRRSWTVISFPYGYDYGESPELMRAIAVAHARFDKLYEFWNNPPYHMANYTPLFPLINGIFVHFFGVQYQSGRLLAWTSSLLFIAVIAWLAWREVRSPFAPLVSALLWFSVNYVWDWTPLNREDEVGMLFSILGLLVFYEGYVRPARRGEAARSERAVWLALPLFLAAIYTRQTTIEAAAACGFYLLVKRPSLAVKWTLVFAVVAGGIFALVDVLTQGAFYLNVITGNLNVFHWSRVTYFGHQFWDYYQVGALLSIFFLITQIVLRRQQVFSAWLLITFVVAVTIGKVGAAENYVLLPWGATCLCAGAATGRLHNIARWLWQQRRLPLLPQLAGVVLALPLGFVLLLHAQLTLHTLYSGNWTQYTFALSQPSGIDGLLLRWTRTGWYLHVLPKEVKPLTILKDFGYRYKPIVGSGLLQEDQYLDKIVHQEQGDVFDEDMSHLLMAGKRIYIQPFEFSEEALLGQWNQQPFLQSIAHQQFPLVIATREITPNMHWERYTPQMAQAFSRYYCLDRQLSDYYVYTPCKGK